MIRSHSFMLTVSKIISDLDEETVQFRKYWKDRGTDGTRDPFLIVKMALANVGINDAKTNPSYLAKILTAIDHWRNDAHFQEPEIFHHRVFPQLQSLLNTIVTECKLNKDETLIVVKTYNDGGR